MHMRCRKGEVCSHIAALMFYLLEDFMKQDHSDLPTDTAATDHLQQWHVPPRDVSARPVEGIKIRKAEYGKLYNGLSVIITACTPSAPNPIMTMYRHSS